MRWSELYGKDIEPTLAQISEFAATPLWDDLAEHLRTAYNAAPKLFYSGCSMDGGYWMGWNVKYGKSGKALCSLYPKQGYFAALIAVGEKEKAEAELMMPHCDAYTRELYASTKAGAAGKSLGVEVTSESILRDVKALIAIRAGKKKIT